MSNLGEYLKTYNQNVIRTLISHNQSNEENQMKKNIPSNQEEQKSQSVNSKTIISLSLSLSLSLLHARREISPLKLHLYV